MLSRVFAWCLMGCAATTTNATQTAVGVEGWQRVRLGTLSLELPREALGTADIRWKHGDARATLTLFGAPLGATLEGLTDHEVRALSALEPDARVQVTHTRWLGRDARLIRSDERSVLVTMRNPWRVARLFVRGANAERLSADSSSSDSHLVDVHLDTQAWSLDSARFEAVDYVLTIDTEISSLATHRRALGELSLGGRAVGSPEALQSAWARIAQSATISDRRAGARSDR